MSGKRDATSNETTASIWAVPAMKVALSIFAISIVIALITGFYGIPLRRLVRDPAATFKYPPYIGFFSHIGIIFMVSTGAVTGFAAWVSHRLSLENVAVLGATSALSFLLAIDDIFMLHEQASRLGEVFVVGSYGIIALAIWFKLQANADRFDLRGLKVTFYFLGLSVFADLFKIYGPFADWLEDFSKLAGFGAWLTFWAGFAGHTLTSKATKTAIDF